MWKEDWWLAALSGLGLVVLSSNALVVAVIAAHPRLHTCSNGFVLNLAVAAGLAGLSAMLSLTGEGRDLCRARVALTLTGWTATVHAALVVSLDRFIAVVWPFRYLTLVTRRSASVALFALWLYSAALGASTLQRAPRRCHLLANVSQTLLTYCTCNFAVVLTSVACCSYAVIRVARRQVRRCGGPRASRLKYERAVAVVLAIMLLCMLPLVAVLFLGVGRGHVTDPSRIAASFLSQVGCLLTPALYALRSRDFRLVARRLLARRRPSVATVDSCV